jgi:hypothetical protein
MCPHNSSYHCKANFIIVCFWLVSSFSHAQSFVVSSKDNAPIPFDKTFNWYSENEDSLSLESYYLHDAQLKSDLTKAIAEELQNLGYLKNQINPSLLVRFYVFDSPLRLYGFDRFNSSQKNLLGNSDTAEKSNYNVDPGTLLISFVHPVTNKIMWEGFASGLIDSHAIKKNPLMVNEAVRLVLQEFAYQAGNSNAQLD